MTFCSCPKYGYDNKCEVHGEKALDEIRSRLS